MVSIAFKDGAAWYRSRYVRTPAYVEEVEQGRGVLYRGFGTNKPGGWLANAFDVRDKVRHAQRPACLSMETHVGNRFWTEVRVDCHLYDRISRKMSRFHQLV